ncbi:MAG TPA: PEP-CTERM sorting domain-containing protein [Nitrospiraceae bacterium]|nr:PEP-CTERM sorting domain-containing protein [Nitrospiraceae bacterium]
MRQILSIILTTVVLMSIDTPIPYASVVTINPRAIGEPEKSFAASSIGLDYASAVSQTITGAFSETGGGAFNNFYFPDSTSIVDKTGLNKDYHLSAVYTASGTAAPSPQGFTAAFNTFGLKIYANTILVGRSTGLVAGTAQLVPDSLSHASGDFDVVVNFAAVGGFFSSNIRTAEFTGRVDSSTVSTGSTFYSLHTGSGNLSFTTSLSQSLTTLDTLIGGAQPAMISNPEPATFFLLGSGLSGLIIFYLRRRWRRTETQS